MPLGRMRSQQDSLNRICAPSASIVGTAINTAMGSGHSCAPQHNSLDVLYYSGASLNTGGTSGLLAVHLIDDPAGTWYLLDLVAGAGIKSIEFDLVGDSTLGSTVTINTAYLYIYPGRYKNGYVDLASN